MRWIVRRSKEGYERRSWARRFRIMPSGPESGSSDCRCSPQKKARGRVNCGFCWVVLGKGVTESTSFALMKDVGCCRVDTLWLALMKRADESVLVIHFCSLGERMIATTRSWSCCEYV